MNDDSFNWSCVELDSISFLRFETLVRHRRFVSWTLFLMHFARSDWKENRIANGISSNVSDSLSEIESTLSAFIRKASAFWG